MYSMWLTEEQQQIWRGYLEVVSRLQTAMQRQLQQDSERTRGALKAALSL